MMRVIYSSRSSNGFHGKVIDHQCSDVWSWCPGFEVSQLKPGSMKRRDRSWRVILSISMFEPAWYVRKTLANALSRTLETTLIVLHLDAGTNYASTEKSREHLAWIWAQERIEVSCFRHHVQPYTGTVLLSQLSNLQWARCRGLTRYATHVVFQASNMWWWRSEMENAVLTHSSSTPRISSIEQCATYSAEQHRREDGTYQICFPVHSSKQASSHVISMRLASSIPYYYHVISM